MLMFEAFCAGQFADLGLLEFAQLPVLLV